LKVATDVAGRLAISSQRCPSDRIAGALAPAPSMDSLWALVWPYCSPWPDCAAVGGAGVLVRVGAGALLPDATPNLCGQVSAGAAHPLWTGPTATSAASLGLLATPDGRAIVRLPGEATQVLCATAGGVSAGKPSRLVFVTADGSASELVLEAPPSSARVLTPAMAADQRPCSTTFKPALYATVQNGIAVFPLTAETADQPCGQPWVPPAGGEGVSCICGKRPPAGAWPRLLCAPVLDGVVAVAPSPNGRALYVVVDNDVERRLVEFDVDRDAQGHVRGLSYLRQASLGKVSVTAAVTPDPAGISFTREGKMAEATVAGEGTIVVIQ
jgi:hypothetical protein